MTIRRKQSATGIAGMALVMAALSCGGSQAPTATAPPSSTVTTTAPSSSVAWKDMNKEQRVDYMKKVVYPNAKEAFVGYDAKRYSDMNCATCHGDGVKDGTFKMPNPKLPKLPADEAGFKKLAEQKPEAAKFMGGKVVPAMAKMLGEEPFNPQTHQGFGCFECHTK